jgi:hypothetical protein
MTIKTKFDIEQRVYLVHDPDQVERIITEFSASKFGHQYLLICGSDESWHYEFEISKEKDNVQKFKN